MRRDRIGCWDFLRAKLSRRTVLKVGGLGLAGMDLAGLAGMNLPALLQAEQRLPKRRATARSVILLFQFGGASHLDSFDPKPSAPREIRGEFAAIKTRVPGMLVCEHLPRMARIADTYALIRSVYHTRSCHNPPA